MIETTNTCHLLCDRMLVSTTRCVKGLWTGRPNLGFWCNEEKPGVKGVDSGEKTYPISYIISKVKAEHVLIHTVSLVSYSKQY